MPIALERSYDRSVRIEASLDDLFEELDTVSGLARFIPQLDGPVDSPDQDHGPCHASFSVGLLSFEFDGQISISRAVRPHCLAISIRAPGLRLELEGVFEFTVNAGHETTLRYGATIRSTHPVLRRMRGALTSTLEEHVDSTTELIAVRARQYTHAKRALMSEIDPG